MDKGRYIGGSRANCPYPGLGLEDITHKEGTEKEVDSLRGSEEEQKRPRTLTAEEVGRAEGAVWGDKIRVQMDEQPYEKRVSPTMGKSEAKLPRQQTMSP